MVRQGSGHIVNTASIEGLVPFPGTVSYVASKFGVVGLSTALRMEGEELGVNVSVVCPGYIKTAILIVLICLFLPIIKPGPHGSVYLILVHGYRCQFISVIRVQVCGG